MSNLLVVVNGSHPAPRAVELAADLVQQDGGRLTLLYVVDPPRAVTSGPYLCGFPEESAKLAGERLARLCTTIPEGVPVHTILHRGWAVDAVVRRAAAAEHDVIIIGIAPNRGLLVRRCLTCAVRRKSSVPVVTITRPTEPQACCHRIRQKTDARMRAAGRRCLLFLRGSAATADSDDAPAR